MKLALGNRKIEANKTLTLCILMNSSISFDTMRFFIVYMDLDATKPVFRVSDKMRFKPACSAIETS